MSQFSTSPDFEWTATAAQPHRFSNRPDPDKLADQMLDDVFTDLENTLNTPAASPQSYPFSRSRRPLRAHSSPLDGGLVAATLATLALLGSVLLLKHGLQLSASVPVPLAQPLSESTTAETLALAEAESLQRSLLDRSQIDKLKLPIAEDNQDKAAAPQEGPPPRSSVPGNSTRSPQASAPTRPAAPAPAALGGLPPSLKLVGIMRHPGEPIALIVMNGEVRQVPVGQAVDGGWRVSRIAPYSVAISNGAQNVNLPLGQEL
ncbi:MAG: hypothetical protein HC921_22360 [Synechococcaceae cyanobacterium SM2_3_1]|nr:hypothetical protein [Synechococcaceae cyanobacterium SM2_3_1]